VLKKKRARERERELRAPRASRLPRERFKVKANRQHVRRQSYGITRVYRKSRGAWRKRSRSRRNRRAKQATSLPPRGNVLAIDIRRAFSFPPIRGVVFIFNARRVFPLRSTIGGISLKWTTTLHCDITARTYTRIHNAGINECSIGFVQLHVRKRERERGEGEGEDRDGEWKKAGLSIEGSFAGEARYRNKYRLTASGFYSRAAPLVNYRGINATIKARERTRGGRNRVTYFARNPITSGWRKPRAPLRFARNNANCRLATTPGVVAARVELPG